MDRAELRKGIDETRRYLLSHHPPSEYDRCYAPVVSGRRIHLCARCAGIYPGIVAGLLAFAFAPVAITGVALVAVLPLPALVDWLATRRARSGSNVVRTATGAALGYGYALGLGHLLVGGDVRVLAISLAYGLVAGLLLVLDRPG